MVIVNIAVPALDEHFDVRLDDATPIHTLLEELTEVICQSQKLELGESGGQYLLCSQDTGEILPLTKTLSECAVRTGARLIFV